MSLTSTDQTFWQAVDLCLCMQPEVGLRLDDFWHSGKLLNSEAGMSQTRSQPTSQTFINNISRDEHSAVRFSVFSHKPLSFSLFQISQVGLRFTHACPVSCLVSLSLSNHYFLQWHRLPSLHSLSNDVHAGNTELTSKVT